MPRLGVLALLATMALACAASAADADAAAAKKDVEDPTVTVSESVAEEECPTAMVEEMTGFPVQYVVALAAMVVLAALVGLVVRGKGAGFVQKDTVALLGLPGSGKTAMFFRLVTGSDVGTQTSMQPNEAPVAIGAAGSAKTLVDYPGHYKLRHAAQAVIHRSCGIVFCIDAIDWEANLSGSAEYLVSILTDPQVVLTNPQAKLAIACTKRDVGHSYKSTVIKKQLEAEIEKIRKTKSNVVSQMAGGDAEAANLQLGVDEEKFSFEAHSPLPTTFIDVGKNDKKDSGSAIWEWINTCA